MNTRLPLMILCWCLGVTPLLSTTSFESTSPPDLASLSTTQLEARLEQIDSQLDILASLSLRGGIGSIGYRSFWENETQWVEIELDQAYPIHDIIIVPCLTRHPTDGFQSDAFPGQLKVLAGTKADRTGSVIAEYAAPAGSMHGIEPLVLSVSETMASWIRVEATALSERSFDGLKVLQLSEILVFSKSQNVALNRPVRCSSSDERGITGAWNKRFLVDGFMPYLMDSAVGPGSYAFIAVPDGSASLTVDLGSLQSISGLHMHAVEQGDTVPQAYYGDLGIPSHMRIESATKADFSDPSLLLEYRKKSINETGPIIMLELPETTGRYIRVTTLPIEDSLGQNIDSERVGFAEIEVYSDGVNVALNKAVTSDNLRFGRRRLEALTDGSNFYGRILPVKDWMIELATRGALIKQRPLVLQQLNLSYERQKSLLARMIQLVVLLTVLIALIILIDRYMRQREISQLRERIAADLHDDLGANIHTIGLISDVARKSIDSRSELIELLDQIRDFTERSGEAARYCTNILEARGIYEDLVHEMEQFSSRILADMDYENVIEGKEFLPRLSAHKRIYLFLFYKECITNILRHSGATKARTHLSLNHKSLTMTITDNGKGLKNRNSVRIPRSLRRRAKLLRAKLKSKTPDEGGTQFILNLKYRTFGIFK